MDIDVTTITSKFCQFHCQNYDSNYQPSGDDYVDLYEHGLCIYTEYAFPCQLLELDSRSRDSVRTRKVLTNKR